MHQTYLSEISFEAALELLALRKEALAKGEVEAMPPELLAQTDVFSSIGQRIAEKTAAQKQSFDPNLGQALATAGGGALLGGIGGLATARPGRRGWRSALEGAAAGAALGGGASLVDQAAGLGLGDMGSKALNSVQQMTPGPVSRAIGAAREGAGRVGDALKLPVASKPQARSELEQVMNDMDPAVQKALAAAMKKQEENKPIGWGTYASISGLSSLYGAAQELRKNPAIDPERLRAVIKREVLTPWLGSGGKGDTAGMQMAQFRDDIAELGRKWRIWPAHRSPDAWQKGTASARPKAKDISSWVNQVIDPTARPSDMAADATKTPTVSPTPKSPSVSALSGPKATATGVADDAAAATSEASRGWFNRKPKPDAPSAAFQEFRRATNKVKTVDEVKQLLRHSSAAKDADLLADTVKAVPGSLAHGRRALAGGVRGFGYSILPNIALSVIDNAMRAGNQAEVNRILDENPSYRASMQKWLATQPPQ